MSRSRDADAPGYDDSYQGFDSPLMGQIRLEAYGTDIGQHSWVIAEELRKDVARLGLTSRSRLLDLGCGPCGPLTFVAGLVGCRATGIDVSAAAITSGRARSAALGLDRLVVLAQADLDGRLPLQDGEHDAAMSLDVVLHLRDRAAFFREVARALAPGGKLLFTDAGVATGPVSDEERRLRSFHGSAQLVPPGFNERALDAAGFRLVEREDRTESILANATGRRAARDAHRRELELIEGTASFERQQLYLSTVVELARRGAAKRMMYVAEVAR